MAYYVGVPADNVGLIGFPGVVHLGVHPAPNEHMNTSPISRMRYWDLFQGPEAEFDGRAPVALDLATVANALQMPVDSYISSTFMTYTDIGCRCINNIRSSQSKRYSKCKKFVHNKKPFLMEIVDLIFQYENLMLISISSTFTQLL